MNTQYQSIFQEKMVRLLSVEVAGKLRHFYDTNHVEERFVYRGLQHLRPKTFQEVMRLFGLTSLGAKEQGDAFVGMYPRFQRDYPEQDRNYRNLRNHMIKLGIPKIVSEFGDKENGYVIWSKKFNMGIALSWRHDRDANNDGLRHAYGRTALNPFTPRILASDYKVLVEKFQREGLDYAPLNECNIDEDSPWFAMFYETGKIYSSFDIVNV